MDKNEFNGDVLALILLKLETLENILKEKVSEKYFSPNEASVRLNMAKSTLYKKHSQGQIEAINTGKQLYFSEKNLRDFLLKHNVKSRVREKSSDIDEASKQIFNRLNKEMGGKI